jgi:hypothetical protein
MSDITFKIKGNTFNAHKIIVSVSPVLAAMFDGKFKHTKFLTPVETFGGVPFELGGFLRRQRRSSRRRVRSTGQPEASKNSNFHPFLWDWVRRVHIYMLFTMNTEK